MSPGAARRLFRTRSAALRKELSLRDLAFAQILFIVGLQWVGVAAKQGPSHVVFWLIAIALFYIPSAIVAVWLARAMPLEGGSTSGRNSASTSSPGASWPGTDEADRVHGRSAR